MSYIEENVLSDNEKIIFSPVLCYIQLFWKCVWGVLFCWLLLIPTIKGIVYAVRINHTEYAITNKKLIEKYGVFSVHCDEMGLNKIENVTLETSFFGRLFHYGTVVVQGTNRNNIYFRNVKDPENVKKQINNILYSE